MVFKKDLKTRYILQKQKKAIKLQRDYEDTKNA